MNHVFLVLALILAAPTKANAVEFERVVIDDNFPGAYQVEVADVNGDKKPDVIAVGGGTCAWYENPTWKKRIVTTPKQTPGIISSTTADLDGDGLAEIAIAYEFSMNEPTKGKLVLATQGKRLDDPWLVTPVTDNSRASQPGATIGGIHRLRWARLHGPLKNPVLMVAPIFGPSAKPPAFQEEPAHLFFFDFGTDPKSGRSLPARTPIGDAPVLHAIDVSDVDGDGIHEIFSASNLGVTRFHMFASNGSPRFTSEILAPGAPGDAPKKGASEVHVGTLKNGLRFLATVEPWHGTDVAVYLSDKPKSLTFGARNVIDTSLKEGHALWVADVDGDGDDEIFAGFRGPGTSVLLYDFNGTTWDRSVVDPFLAAQDLRGGDLDNDGTPDIVAVGGKTHNVVWYKPRKN